MSHDIQFQISIRLILVKVTRKKGEKMFKIGIPLTMHQIFAIFHLFRVWNKDENSLCNRGKKLFYFVFYLSFGMSLFVGALQSPDDNERAFLAVGTVSCTILIYRMWFILWRKKEILSFVREIGIHYTDDRMGFYDVDEKLKTFDKFVRYFLLMISTAVTCMYIVFPVMNEDPLFVNVAFPLDRSNSEIAMFMAFAFLVGGAICGFVAILIAITLWFVILSFSVEYKLLGNQFRNMGTIRTPETESEIQLEVSINEQQKLYRNDFVKAIRHYDKINEYIGTDQQTDRR